MQSSTINLSLTKIATVAGIIGVPLAIIFGLIGVGIIDPLLLFCVTGEFELTYTNCELGFQVSKPNQHWDFDTNIAKIKIERTEVPPDDYFLGGVYLATTDRDHVLVAVFDDKKLEVLPLQEWLDAFENVAVNKYDSTTLKKEISTDGDWGVYRGEFFDINGRGLGEQILQVKNGKVYLIKSMGLHPDVIPIEQKEDFIKIFNSFKTFKTLYKIIFT